MSNIFRLNWRDLLKGLIVAVFSAVIAFVMSLIQNGMTISVEILQQVGSVAILAALGYLSKNLLSDSEGKLGGKI